MIVLTLPKIAAVLSKHVGRTITHVKLSAEDKVKKYMSIGLPEPSAQFMTSLETITADGLEERPEKDFAKVTGEKGETMDEWVAKNKEAWL